MASWCNRCKPMRSRCNRCKLRIRVYRPRSVSPDIDRCNQCKVMTRDCGPISVLSGTDRSCPVMRESTGTGVGTGRRMAAKC